MEASSPSVSNGGGGASLSGTANTVTKFTGTTTVGNSTITDNGTNVGVGTASPAQRLHVRKDAVAPTLAEVQNATATGGASAGIALVSDTESFQIEVTSSGSSAPNVLQITDTHAGSKRLIVDPSGLVTIGPNLPDASARFSVQGTTAGVLDPTLTTAQRNAISSPAYGLRIFNGDTIQHEFYNGTAWASMVTPGGFFALDVTLVGGTKTQASGKDLSAAAIVAVLLKTPTTAVGAPRATISGNSVVVTSFAAGAVQAVTDASTYTVMLVGAV